MVTPTNPPVTRPAAQGNQGPSGPEQATFAQPEEMTPEEVADALEKGQLKALLSHGPYGRHYR